MSDGHPRILLVDDDKWHRESLRLILEEEGFECREAENGADAIEILESQSYDLVLTDLDMPVMNGLQLVTWIIQGSFARSVPIIVLTGNLRKESKDQVLAAGANFIFTKPYKLTPLLRTIRSYFPKMAPLHLQGS